jgi:hypothetical protein
VIEGGEEDAHHAGVDAAERGLEVGARSYLVPER